MQPQNFTSQRRELLKLTKTELIKRCKKHKLSTRGGKADLTDRLLSKQKLRSSNAKQIRSRGSQPVKLAKKKANNRSISHEPIKQKNMRSRTPQPPSKSHSKSKSHKKHSVLLINHEEDDGSSMSELTPKHTDTNGLT
eukprot:846324_1